MSVRGTLQPIIRFSARSYIFSRACGADRPPRRARLSPAPRRARAQSSSGIALSKAIKEWEAKAGAPAAEAREVLLHGGLTIDGKKVFVSRLDTAGVGGGGGGGGAQPGGAALRACERLALSTNQVRAPTEEVARGGTTCAPAVAEA